MKRVISLLPSATEILFELNAGEALVGVTHECDYPPEAREKPQLTSARITPDLESREIDRLVREQLAESATLYSLDMELVRRLHPEIVLTQQLCTVCAVGYETVHAAMTSLPSPPEVINLEPRNLEEVFGSIAHVARLLDIPAEAEVVLERLRKRLRSIAVPATRPKLLFLEWLLPPFSAGHWMAELVEAAGAEPVLANRGEHSRQIEWDHIHNTDFDILVISCCGFSVERTLQDVRSSPDLAALRKQRPELRLIVFDGNHYFSRPGPRLVESAELLNAALAERDANSVRASVPVPYIELSPLFYSETGAGGS